MWQLVNGSTCMPVDMVSDMAKTKTATKPPPSEAPGREAAAEWVDPKLLRPWERNPRKISEAAVQKVSRSIKRFGFGAPIVARRENNEIIAGHTRHKAALRLGLPAVPVRFLDLDADEAHKYAVADNKTGEETKWDAGGVAELVGEWSDAGDDLEGLGFDEDEIAKMTGQNYESVVEEIDVSAARAEFYLSAHGPLPLQVEVLDALRAALAGIDGIHFTITTTEL